MTCQPDRRLPYICDRLKDLDLDEAYNPRILHRLDSPVTGCLVLGLSPYGTRTISKTFRDRKMGKTYLAILRPSASSRIRTEKSGVVSGEMTTHWSVETMLECEGRDDLALCRLRPIEGRKHQLRRHALELNAPVLFDRRYIGESPLIQGWHSIKQEGIALHCAKLEWRMGLDMHSVSCDPPRMGIWQELRDRGVDVDTIINSA